MKQARCVALVAAPATVLSAGAEACLAKLSAHEVQRAQSFKSLAARDSFIAAHLLVRQAAARLTGTRSEDLALGQRCASCGGPHGRPFIVGHPQLHVSLSHSHAAVAAAAADAPVGIDVESWDAMQFEALRGASVFTPRELAILSSPPGAAGERAHDGTPDLRALRLWLRKECLIKLGLLSLDTLGACDVSDPYVDDRWAACGAASRHGPLRFTEWTDPHSRSAGAVACPHPVQVHRL